MASKKKEVVLVSSENDNVLSDDVSMMFDDKKEKRLATELLNRYTSEYSIESISDKNTLKQLIYLEVYQIQRLQKAANELQESTGVVPINMLDAIHKNISKITELKNTLGLNKKEDSDSYSALDLIKKKLKIWRENNQASRTLVCGHCGKMLLLKIRTDAWEAQKHPYFKDRLLGNPHLIRLYQEGKLTEKDLSLIFETSTDYISWLIDKWGRIGKESAPEELESGQMEASSEQSG